MGAVMNCKNISHPECLSNAKIMTLIYSSALGKRLNLSSSALTTLFSFAYHYNTLRNDMFPTQNYISTRTGLSLSSIKRAIKELGEKGLILKIRTKSGNTYKFTQKFFEELNLIPTKSQIEPFRKSNMTPPKIEQLEKNNLNKTLSIEMNDLNNLKQIDSMIHTQFKPILNTLGRWNYSGAENLVKIYDSKYLLQLIKEVENRNPKNKGAYLRKLIEKNSQNLRLYNTTEPEKQKDERLTRMLKNHYWCHNLTGKVYLIKYPNTSSLNIRFNKETSQITMLEDGLIDILENFQPSTKEQYEKQTPHNKRLSRIEIIGKLLENNQIQEAKQLSRMFKINFEELKTA